MKKPRGGTWLGIACALIIAFGAVSLTATRLR